MGAQRTEDSFTVEVVVLELNVYRSEELTGESCKYETTICHQSVLVLLHLIDECARSTCSRMYCTELNSSPAGSVTITELVKGFENEFECTRSLC